VHLILEGQLLAQALVLVLQVHTGQGLSLQLLAKIIQLATQTIVLQGEFLGLILELLFHALKLHGEAESGSWQKFENGRKNSQNNKINHNKPKTWVVLEVFCI